MRKLIKSKDNKMYDIDDYIETLKKDFYASQIQLKKQHEILNGILNKRCKGEFLNGKNNNERKIIGGNNF